jgi:hypothetical protein
VKSIYTTVASASLIISFGLSATARAASFDESLIKNQLLLNVFNRIFNRISWDCCWFQLEDFSL